MKAYSYDENTKQYAGEIECQIDPLESIKKGESVWLLPANSTFKKPKKEKEGFYVVWDGEDWVYQEIPVEPEPEPYVPTEDEKKEAVRFVRNNYLSSTDYTQLPDAPFNEDEKESYREYRQYLRDYTNGENWWEQNPYDYETWLEKNYSNE